MKKIIITLAVIASAVIIAIFENRGYFEAINDIEESKNELENIKYPTIPTFNE